jgi:hypothetical protein
MQALPSWATEISAQYESHAASQFVLYGNTLDQFLLTSAAGVRLVALDEYVHETLLGAFDVILTYDLGNGLRVTRGQKIFATWPSVPAGQTLPRPPREAVDLLTHYIRYLANVRRVKGETVRVAFFIKEAQLALPTVQAGLNYDLNAMALLIKAWASETGLSDHPFASFLIVENLNDLHPLIVNDPRSANLRVPLPAPADLTAAFTMLLPKHSIALGAWKDNLATPAGQLAGATMVSVHALLKTKEYRKEPITDRDLAALKKELVEKDCAGLIEFVEPTRTLDDLYGQDAIKAWLRQDIALWKQGDIMAMPMGYLLCGPVGTGKTYMVECLAGEAGVPVVKLKNFRDKWVGSTEGNLEKIFRLLHALGRCYVFIDEADQALGKRNQDGDSGVGGRVYSMMAKEMSDSANRGRIVWILASSRPDMIEVDLKRPGRVDVKIPIFPTTTPEEGYRLIRSLAKRRGLVLADTMPEPLRDSIPQWLTPGAAEALAVKLYRHVKTSDVTVEVALDKALRDYQPPVAEEIMRFQIGLAVAEATDLGFVPESLRKIVA